MVLHRPVELAAVLGQVDSVLFGNPTWVLAWPGAGFDFHLSDTPCAHAALCPIRKYWNPIKVLTTSTICPIIACEYSPTHRFTRAPPQPCPSCELFHQLHFLYLLSLQSLAHSCTLLPLFSDLPPFVFNALRTLFPKHPGVWGFPPPN